MTHDDLELLPVPLDVKEGAFTHVHTYGEYRDFEPVSARNPSGVGRVTLVVGAEDKDYATLTNYKERRLSRAEAIHLIEFGKFV